MNSENTKQANNTKKDLFEWTEAVCVAIVMVIAVFTFLFRVVGVVGDSMVDTLHDGDRLIISNFLYTPSRGDIIVSNQPWSRDEAIIKRVIATEGDTIDIDFETGIVYLKKAGETKYVALDETYTNTITSKPIYPTVEFPFTVSEGCVFAMGDNRNSSMDSRSIEIGEIDERYILGKVLLRVFPFDDISSFKVPEIFE